ncbi:DDB1- and CUL4-associated factor 12 [Kappamyces sp. JEL0829]|nr:DDB1- and CUL4-associated factor 12 [Kappamyces sp. JEL0829]
MDWLGAPMSSSFRSDYGSETSSTTLVDDDLSSCQSSNQTTVPHYTRYRTPFGLTGNDDILHYAARKLPGSLKESEFGLNGQDKVFSAAWLSDTQVVLGTKCQNVMVLDVNTGKKVVIPSVNPLEEDASLNAHCHGIHSICINPSRTHLAVGAGKPSKHIKDFAIFVYQIPSFQPVAILLGHQDIVFSISWLDDTTLVSGSRDKSVKTWNLDKAYQVGDLCFPGIPSIAMYEPAESQTQHLQKVRDLVIDRQTTQFFTLSADGSVKIWDSYKSKVMASVPLSHTNETVCLALDPNHHLVSVGSQEHVSIIDPRVGGIVHTFKSLDDGWGVRSMTIHHGLLSIGGGLGRISFYDLRAQGYVEWESQTNPSQRYIESGTGWLDRDVSYVRHFTGTKVLNAVYSLAYDESHGKLFAAGGPLQLNLRGSYAAIWQ